MTKKDELDNLMNKLLENSVFDDNLIEQMMDHIEGQSVEETLVDNTPKKLISDITNDMIEKFDHFEDRYRLISASDDISKHIAEYASILHNLSKSKYILGSETIDIDDFVEPVSGMKLKDNLLLWIESNFEHSLIILYYEIWKESNNDSHLNNVLRRIKNIFEGFYSKGNIYDQHIEYDELRSLGDTSNIKLLGYIVNELQNFFSYYIDIFKTLSDDSYIEKKENYKYLQIETLKFSSDDELDKEGIFKFVINYREIIELLHVVLLRYEHQLSEKISLPDIEKKERRVLSRDIAQVKDLISKYSDVHQWFNLVYRSDIIEKNDFSNTEKNKMLYLLDEITNILEEMNNDVSEEEIVKRVSNIKLMFLADKDQGYSDSVEIRLEKFLNIVQNRFYLNKSDNEEYISVRNRVYKSLEHVIDEMYKGDEVLNSLTTAEYLYNRYVTRCSSSDYELMDYSFISMLYYSTLEKTLNRLIYFPYIKDLKKANLGSLDRLHQTGKFHQFINGVVSKNLVFRHVKSRWSGGKFNDSLQMGTFSYFFNIKDEIKIPTGMKKYLSKRFKDYNENFNEIQDIMSNLEEIKDRRNRAAHGVEIISQDLVSIDRSNVYELDHAIKCRNILTRILDRIRPFDSSSMNKFNWY